MLYGSDTWPINANMTRLINSSATSVYRVMTSEKRMNKVRNSTVLARHDLIYTLHSRQLRFLGHLLRSDRALYALFGPTQGYKTGRGRPRSNYINYIQ